MPLPRQCAGSEPILRLLVRAAGLEFDIQVFIDGVGRVDTLIEGCLVVEADSRRHHAAAVSVAEASLARTSCSEPGALWLQSSDLLRARTGFRSVIVSTPAA
jgi:hypothetical protein